MQGEIGILNVGAGDTKLSFDPNNPEERDRAKRIVADMLRRGFALLIAVGADDQGRPIYRRADGFDEETCEYIIVDAVNEGDAANETGDETEAAAPRRGKRRRQTRIAAEKASGVAVSRPAGG